MTTRRLELHRDVDETGVSGTGVVAEGVHFVEPDIVVLRWTSATPTSVVFHENGVASVEAVHGHGGRTRIVWCDEESYYDGPPSCPHCFTRHAVDSPPFWCSKARTGDVRSLACRLCGTRHLPGEAPYFCPGALA